MSQVSVDGAVSPLSLDCHRKAFEQALQDFAPDWVIIDPLVAFHERREIDATQVRQLLMYLATVARERHIAVTVIQHPNKTFLAPDLYRIRGSLDFVAAVRAVLRVTSLEDGRRAIVLDKLNLAPKPAPLGFTLESGDGAAKVTWLGEIQLPTQKTKHQQAKDFLESVLSSGPIPSEQVLEQAKAEGIGESTLRLAKSALGIRAVKTSPDGPWAWRLPGQSNPSSLAPDGNKPVSDIPQDQRLGFGSRPATNILATRPAGGTEPPQSQDVGLTGPVEAKALVSMDQGRLAETPEPKTLGHFPWDEFLDEDSEHASNPR